MYVCMCTTTHDRYAKQAPPIHSTALIAFARHANMSRDYGGVKRCASIIGVIQSLVLPQVGAQSVKEEEEEEEKEEEDEDEGWREKLCFCFSFATGEYTVASSY